MEYSIYIFSSAIAFPIRRSTLAAPTGAYSHDVEGCQAKEFVAIIDVVEAFENTANFIVNRINQNNKVVCRILLDFRHELTFNSRVALNSLGRPSERWPTTILDGTT